MPITEIVRVIASADGRDPEGHAVRVDLRVDTDGRFGADEDASGFPAFWLAAGDRLLGPYEHEDDAIKAAEEQFGALFP